MSNAVDDRTWLLQNRLEEKFELHTGQLTELIMRIPKAQGTGEETAATVLSSSRQALSDIADALRRMAEGTYGTCESCHGAIPFDRLEIWPQARFCMKCQP